MHLMQTVGTLFGTGAVVGQTGVLANSSLCFAYAGGSGANRIVPGRRVEQNPCLAMVLEARDRLQLLVGSPGGRTRVETVRQMLVNVVDYGMSLQLAVDAARSLTSSDASSIDFEARYGPVDPALRSRSRLEAIRPASRTRSSARDRQPPSTTSPARGSPQQLATRARSVAPLTRRFVR